MKFRLNREELRLPGAIVLAGLILAIGTYLVRTSVPGHVYTGDPTAARPVTPDDHLLGNPAAPVVVLEYGDIESAYSKTFQETMGQIMTEYAAGGKVAWVYRHFPVTILHPTSEQDAEAAECVSSLGSPSLFWQFIDAIDAQAPQNDQFNPSGYSAIVTSLGVNPVDFSNCLSSGKFTKRVADDAHNALAAGATGSPYIILEIKGQKPIPIQGALPYTSMKKVIDQAIVKAGA